MHPCVENLTQDLLGSLDPHSDGCPRNPSPQNPPHHMQIPTYTFGFVTTFSSVIFLVGIIGNLTVFFIILHNRDMRNATNMCLLSLSAADMLVLCVCMPSALVEFYGKDIWYLGKTMCKFLRCFHKLYLP